MPHFLYGLKMMLAIGYTVANVAMPILVFVNYHEIFVLLLRGDIQEWYKFQILNTGNIQLNGES